MKCDVTRLRMYSINYDNLRLGYFAQIQMQSEIIN